MVKKNIDLNYKSSYYIKLLTAIIFAMVVFFTSNFYLPDGRIDKQLNVDRLLSFENDRLIFKNAVYDESKGMLQIEYYVDQNNKGSEFDLRITDEKNKEVEYISTLSFSPNEPNYIQIANVSPNFYFYTVTNKFTKIASETRSIEQNQYTSSNGNKSSANNVKESYVVFDYRKVDRSSIILKDETFKKDRITLKEKELETLKELLKMDASKEKAIEELMLQIQRLKEDL